MISAMELKNIETIKREGLAALSAKLGPVGMVHFIRLFENGNGDFTEERKKLLEEIEKKEILEFLKSEGEM